MDLSEQVLRLFQKFNVSYTLLFNSIASTLVAVFAFQYVFQFLFDDEAPVEISVPLPEQAKPGWKGEALVKPSIKVPGLSAIECYCPATGQKLGVVNPSTPDGIDRAVAAAKEAQIKWAETTFSQRRKVMRTMLRFLLRNQESIARVCARDSGKPLLDASFGEILVTAEKLQWTLKQGEAALRPSRRPTNLLMSYKRNTVRYEPLGVVAALVSWNYPFHNFFGPLISALFAGNAIIVKPSERTAWSASYFLAIARESLRACGHSPSLVHSLPLWPETAGHLTSHPDISHITFIGSQPVAKEVLKSAAKSITPVCAELGGKDPSIILDDVSNSSFEAVAHILMRGTFQSAGQNCIGIERVIALPKVYTRLITFLEPRIKALRVGPPLDGNQESDVGAMISDTPFARLESLIADAVTHGARLLAGGKRYIHPDYPSGHYFAPTLLAEVTPSMRIAQEELFAPICVLMRASSVAAAIEIANSTPYALGASVFGSSKRDLEAVVSGVHAGMVSINDFAVFYAVQLPFGGAKGSGFGRFAGEEGLRGLSNVKAVCEDRFWGVGTRIPAPHLYPVRDVRAAWVVARGIVMLGYGGFLEKVGGLWDIVRNLG